MADQRTLGDALTLSPEKLAFIQGENVLPSQPPRRGRKPAVKTVELNSTSETPNEPSKDTALQPRHRRQTVQRATPGPDAHEILNEVLVPITTRLPHRLVQSLRRMCLEQRLRHIKPDSIQDIVETALEEWLAKYSR